MVVLLWNMKKYHRFEYNLAKFSIFIYCIFECFGEILFLAKLKTNGEISDFSKELNYWVFITTMTCSYPVLQALGIIYLKLTHDPLEGISKLDSIQIVSIN